MNPERVKLLMKNGKEVINGYSQEAHEVAKARINQFADDLIPKLVKLIRYNR